HAAQRGLRSRGAAGRRFSLRQSALSESRFFRRRFILVRIVVVRILLRRRRLRRRMRRLWKLMRHDRVGLSWRPELAAGILTNLDRIDIVEVIADDYFDAPRAKIAGLKTLSAQTSVVLHGITQGLASTVRADSKRLAKMARLVETLGPESWSE